MDRTDRAPKRIALLSAAIGDLEAGRFALATACGHSLLATNGEDREAMLVAGLALGATGDRDAAAVLLDRVAQSSWGTAHPCRDLAAILTRIGRTEWIAPQYAASIRRAPEDPALRYAFADWLHEAGHYEEAAGHLGAALRADPGFAPAHNLLGMVFAELGQTGAAITHLRHAIELEPRGAAAWGNLGMLLRAEDRFLESVAAHDQAIRLSPNDARLRVNRVVTLLDAGRWPEAWLDHHWRHRLPGAAGAIEGAGLKTLEPGADLTGRTVLAVHEDGFGDTIQFARYLPLLAARGARVIALVPQPLVRLLRSLAGLDAVLGPDDPFPEADAMVPMGSLPGLFATTVTTVPASIPYLHADADRVAAWQADIPTGNLRVGLAWAGQARPWLPGFATLDRRRSMDLATLSPLASVPGLTLVSLQMGDAAAQVSTPPPGMALHDPMPDVRDFADTAAIIAGLDVVVSVDTSVAHLAGALGKPVYLLDRYDHCWRWLSGRVDSPWYPTLRLFRQTSPGDWAAPVADVAASLGAMAARLDAEALSTVD